MKRKIQLVIIPVLAAFLLIACSDTDKKAEAVDMDKLKVEI